MIVLARKILGAIFPISGQLLERLLSGGKNVFIKAPTTFRRLDKGSVIVFYQTWPLQKIVAEGIITEIFRGLHAEIWNNYGNSLILNESELKQYANKPAKGVSKKRTNELIAFVLKDIRQYKTPITPKDGPVSMTGKYVDDQTIEDYRQFGFAS